MKFYRCRQDNFKIYMQAKGTSMPRTILGGKKINVRKVRRITSPEFKAYCIAIVIYMVWYWCTLDAFINGTEQSIDK